MGYLEDIAAIVDAHISPLERRVEQAERERDDVRNAYDALLARIMAAVKDDFAVIVPVEAVEPTPAIIAEVAPAPLDAPVEPAGEPNGLADLRAAIEKATGQKVAENFAPADDAAEPDQELFYHPDDQILASVRFGQRALYTISEIEPDLVMEHTWDDDTGAFSWFSGGLHELEDDAVPLIVAKRLQQSLADGGREITIDHNETAIWCALEAWTPGRFIGVHDLYDIAKPFGWTLKEGALRARMMAGLDPISGHTDLIETSNDGKLVFRLRREFIGPDSDPDDTDEPTAGDDGWKARVAAIDPQLLARKRCPEAKRTDVWSLDRPAGYDLDLPAMHWGWSTDGRANRVLRSHPFLDWLHATAVGDWGVVRGLDRTPSIHLTSEEDFARCVAAGLVTEMERPALWGHWSIDLTGFDAELAEKEQSWKANAAKAQRNSKRCPRFARTVFRGDALERRLKASDWCAIRLKTLKRMPTWGLKPVERQDPVDAHLPLATDEYPTVLDNCATMDKVWDTASGDFIITGPTPQTRGYGSTSVDFATLWVRPEDALLMKIALA